MFFYHIYNGDFCPVPVWLFLFFSSAVDGRYRGKGNAFSLLFHVKTLLLFPRRWRVVSASLPDSGVRYLMHVEEGGDERPDDTATTVVL